MPTMMVTSEGAVIYDSPSKNVIESSMCKLIALKKKPSKKTKMRVDA
jgi:hypothetical protein